MKKNFSVYVALGAVTLMSAVPLLTQAASTRRSVPDFDKSLIYSTFTPRALFPVEVNEKLFRLNRRDMHRNSIRAPLPEELKNKSSASSVSSSTTSSASSLSDTMSYSELSTSQRRTLEQQLRMGVCPQPDEIYQTSSDYELDVERNRYAKLCEKMLKERQGGTNTRLRPAAPVLYRNTDR